MPRKKQEPVTGAINETINEKTLDAAGTGEAVSASAAADSCKQHCGKGAGGGVDALQKIADTLDALLAVMITEKLGKNGDEIFTYNGKNNVQGTMARVLRGFGLVSVNDGTFPRMTLGKGMGVPDVRYNGEVWSAFPIAGDVYVTESTARDIKFFAGDDCGKGGEK